MGERAMGSRMLLMYCRQQIDERMRLYGLSSGSNYDSLLQSLLQIAHRTSSHATQSDIYTASYADHAISEHIYSQKEVLRQLTVAVRPQVSLTLSRSYGRGSRNQGGES